MAIKFLTNSIVFDHNDPDYLDLTFGAPTDGTTWTLSFWVKRGLGDIATDTETILSAGTGTTDYTRIGFGQNGELSLFHRVASVTTDHVATQAGLLNDPSAWYHVVIAYDSNEAVAADRIKFWLNGIQVTEFNSANYPTSAATSYINTAVEHRIGDDIGGVFFSSQGYLAGVAFVDGTALTPSTFGELQDASWQPIASSPTYGNNGFLLDFETDSALGDDTSGGTNDWTQNSITTANQREDTPTQNHLTFNPYRVGELGATDPDVDFGALRLVAHVTSQNKCLASAALPQTGKYYWEIDVEVGAAADAIRVGISTQLADSQLGGSGVGGNNYEWGIRNDSGTSLQLIHDNAIESTFTDTGTIQTGNYVMVAYDCDSGKLWFGIDGTWLDSGDPGAGTNAAITITAAEIFGGLVIPTVSVGVSGNTVFFRAGTEDLEGTVPTGFVTLRVDDWPGVSIAKPSDYFTYLTWDGDNTSPRTINGADFQPDLAWVKDIANTGNHIISDITKGAGTVHRNNATTIADDAAHLTGEISVFETDGISVQDGATNGNDVNTTGRQYVALLWKEGVLQGLDLVGYVGAAAAKNVAHALTVAPEFMYVRNRDTISDNEIYFDKTIDGTGVQITDPETDSVQANTTNALADSAGPWDDTAPDASNFRVGSSGSTNANLDNHQAYLWAGVEGFSKIGGYIGNFNGGTSRIAPYIYTGFRPKAILIKRLDLADDWALFIREGANTNFGADYAAYNMASQFWQSNLAAADTGGVSIHLCASGFHISGTDSEYNAVGEYAYIAWAEVPFQLASSEQGNNLRTGDGAIDLPLEITATGDDPNQYGDGAIDMPLEITATGDLPNQHGAGAIDMPLQIDAVGININRHGAGDIIMPLEIDSDNDYPGEFGFAGIDMPMEITSTASRNAKHGDAFIAMPPAFDAEGISGDDGGSISMPQLQTSGTITSSYPITGNATLPQLQTSGLLLNAPPMIGNANLPLLQVQGYFATQGDIFLPTLQVSGIMVPGRTLRGNAINLPLLQVSGVGVSPVIITGNARLPQLRTSGIIGQGAPGIGEATLPQLQVSGFLFVPNLATGEATLPALRASGILAPGSIGGGTVILPFVRVNGIIVNGVALAGTVWVMNTETFETTNYSNFDFESLVSYADQPYGVTSGGIFLLAGDDDDGTQIDARLLTGISDRGDENLKEVDNLYLQGDFDSLMFQLYADGQQQVREYALERRSNSTGLIHARAKGSRGLRSRSWQMGLRNLSGGDFQIDKLGLLLRQLTRKTRKN